MPAFSQRNALSAEFRKSTPSIIPLVMSLPRLNSTYANHFQDLDDEWRKIPNVKASLPKEFEVTHLKIVLKHMY